VTAAIKPWGVFGKEMGANGPGLDSFSLISGDEEL